MTRGRFHALWLLALLFSASACVHAQQNETPQPAQSSASVPENTLGPLPDIASLMHQVEQNQRAAEVTEKQYICHSVEVQERTDSGGHVKKTTITEFDHYWSEGVPVNRMVRKDGKSLTPAELAKEDDRIRKEVEKARERRAKAEAEGKPTNARGDEVIPVSRLLELGRFSNPRRVELDGRATIAVDYEGDPAARTRNRAEDVIRDLRGTVWVDENDRAMARAEGYFVNGFKSAQDCCSIFRKERALTSGRPRSTTRSGAQRTSRRTAQPAPCSSSTSAETSGWTIRTTASSGQAPLFSQA